MGDLSTLAKARKELEEMYPGIPDDSVNLTFQDLAVATQNATDKKKSNSKELSPEVIKTSKEGTPLHKIPSLDFSQAMQASNNHNHNHHRHHHNHHLDHVQRDNGDLYSVHHHHSLRLPYQERAGRRHPGIPHSNICTICSNYVYMLRNRCLVCGRVYCRHCVNIGMGEMTEGRKCIECLGRRFSQRYIQKAGTAELMWAEKGPRRSGERGYGHNGVVSSRPRSPMTPRTHVGSNPDPPSFVMGSPYSPYTPTHPHHLAF
ncbi:hypothetical protein ACB098_08G071900 [Castanea mollissima]